MNCVRHGLPNCREPKCLPAKIPYCYSRDEVIALNPIRKAQGLPPLKEGDRYYSC